MLNFWLVATVVLVVANWACIALGWRLGRTVTKPAALLALIAWSLSLGGWQGGMLWFGLGLVFSLAGDVLLLLPPRFFPVGLIAFLLAHIVYIIGFNLELPPVDITSILLLALVGLVYYWIMHRTIRRGMERSSLRGMVSIYGVVISLMLFSALLTLQRPDWNMPAAALSSFGALFFMGSDSLLGYDRFVKRLKWSELAIMVSYHAGQFCLVLGALLHFR
jgi:alkenylglycerophosphocholine/alkenylglycerophosphoethanolamine hydrolase